MKLITARIIADNAKHAKLFSERAKELGEEPESYKPPEVGQRIYDILESMDDPFDEYAYAWGSLVHFSDLLDLYLSVSDSKCRNILEEVKSDVNGHLILLESYFESRADSEAKKQRAEKMKKTADDIYADREDVEMEWYAL